MGEIWRAPGSERPLGVDEPERETAPGVAPPGVGAGVAMRPDAPMGVIPRDWRAPPREPGVAMPCREEAGRLEPPPARTPLRAACAA